MTKTDKAELMLRKSKKRCIHCGITLGRLQREADRGFALLCSGGCHTFRMVVLSEGWKAKICGLRN